MKRKILNTIMAMTLALSLPMSTNAADPTFTEDGSASIRVSAQVTADYTIQIPAALTLADEDGDGNFIATGTVGVKGSIPVTKAVVIVPTSGAEDNTGALTSASTAAGNVALAAVTTAALNSITTDDYEADITLTGTETTDNSELTGKIKQKYVRFASPYFAGSVADCGETKMNSDAGTYATSDVELSVTATEPDTYSGVVVYTFKMVNRT